MKTNYVIIARYAEYLPDYTMNVIGGNANRIVSETYPVVHQQITVVSQFDFTRDEWDQNYELSATVFDKDSEEVIAQGQRETIKVPALSFAEEPDAYVSINALMIFQHIIFPRPGRYRVNIYINELLTSYVDFRVNTSGFFVDRLRKMHEVMERAQDDGLRPAGNQ